MRLINTATLQFEEFFEKEIPSYAILSHTWGSQEVVFKDMSLGREVLMRDKHGGYSKIVETCRIARESGLRYAWVDTCCIDKSSSAELTEAINSMFRWYRDAEICYAYLSDVIPGQDIKDGLERCRWVTRGWTLQELIAPKEVAFYDKEWILRGHRSDEVLQSDLADITGIFYHVLDGMSLERFTVAQIMSWAANRETSRTEDAAYCLLGLFGISMPMIYGEGPLAFLRLQEEIIKKTNDLTILAWNPVQPPSGTEAEYVNILAPHPSAFANSADIQPWDINLFNLDFTLTNKGLRLEYNMYAVSAGSNSSRGTSLEYYVLALGHRGRDKVGIFLRKAGHDFFYRRNRPLVLLAGLEGPEDVFVTRWQTVFLSNSVTRGGCQRSLLRLRHGAYLLEVPPGFRVANVVPEELWDAEDECFLKVMPDRVRMVTVGGKILGERVLFVVLCDPRGPADPSWRVIVCNGMKEDIKYLFVRREFSRALRWSDVEVEMPDVMRHTNKSEVVVGQSTFVVELVEARQSVKISDGDVRMFRARLEIRQKTDHARSGSQEEIQPTTRGALAADFTDLRLTDRSSSGATKTPS